MTVIHESVRNDGVSLKTYLNDLQALLRTQPDAWVRCELHGLTPSAKFVRMEFIEHDAQGRQIAKAQGGCFPAVYEKIQQSFAKSGLSVTTGIKVLVRLRADLQAAYGFQVQVIDIDPSYTLGDLKTRMDAIRQRLVQEKLWDKNRSVSRPTDFERVAVISPPGAAGQGDFRASADILARVNLVTFDYYETSFQTANAPEGIISVLRKIFPLAKAGKYCAVALIRGGGASSDLAWLVDYNLTRALCHMPVPIMTGIGHQRDRTLLDEVACIPCDTPSKVAEYIRTTVCNAGLIADRSYRDIIFNTSSIAEKHAANISELQTQALIDVRETARTVDEKLRKISDYHARAVRMLTEMSGQEVAKISRQIALNAEATQNKASKDILAAAARITSDAGTQIHHADRGLRQCIELALTAPLRIIGEATTSLDRMTRYIQGATYDQMRLTGEAILSLKGNITRLPAGTLSQAGSLLAQIGETVRGTATHALVTVERDMQTQLSSIYSAPAAEISQIAVALDNTTSSITDSVRTSAKMAEWHLHVNRNNTQEHLTTAITCVPPLVREIKYKILENALQYIEQLKGRITAAQTIAAALDPRTVVAAGYAILRNEDGCPMTHVQDVANAKIVSADLRDGSITLQPLQAKKI